MQVYTNTKWTIKLVTNSEVQQPLCVIPCCGSQSVTVEAVPSQAFKTDIPVTDECPLQDGEEQEHTGPWSVRAAWYKGALDP